jgi:hypothetical protein
MAAACSHADQDNLALIAESALALLHRFQQYTTQQCEQCDNVKYEREAETLTVQVEPGMRNGQVLLLRRAPHVHAGHNRVYIRPDVTGSHGGHSTICNCYAPAGDLVLRAWRAHS